MRGFQMIIVRGNLGKDPEVKVVGENVVCSFSLACTTHIGQQEHTEWFAVSQWGKAGEALGKLLQKGDVVEVVGDLRTKVVNEKRFTNLNASKVDVLLCKKWRDNAAPTTAATASADDGDLPF